jgi:hypothetical protein
MCCPDWVNQVEHALGISTARAGSAKTRPQPLKTGIGADNPDKVPINVIRLNRLAHAIDHGDK